MNSGLKYPGLTKGVAHRSGIISISSIINYLIKSNGNLDSPTDLISTHMS